MDPDFYKRLVRPLVSGKTYSNQRITIEETHRGWFGGTSTKYRRVRATVERATYQKAGRNSRYEASVVFYGEAVIKGKRYFVAGVSRCGTAWDGRLSGEPKPPSHWMVKGALDD